MGKRGEDMEIKREGERRPYQVHGVLDVAVRAELGLDVLVAQQAHLGGQVAAVGTQQPPVQRHGRQQRQHRLGQAGRRRRRRRHGRRGRGEEAGRGPHGFSGFPFFVVFFVCTWDKEK